MSNPLKKSATGTKVIEIKPLPTYEETQPIEKAELSTETLKTEYDRLKSEYSVLQREIRKLEKQKVKKLIETKEAIEQEKEHWATEKQQLIEQAAKEGYEQGFQQGETIAMEQFSDRLDKANHMIKLATRDYHDTVCQSDYTVVELAIYVAEKIVRKQLDLDQDVIMRIVKEAIEQVTDEEQVNIYVSSGDYEQLLHNKNELQNLLDGNAKLSIYISKEKEQGYCEIDYPSGKTDVSISTQITQIEKELLRLVAEHKQ